MDPRQYSGQRQNCLRTVNNGSCPHPAQESYEALHKKVQRTIQDIHTDSCTCTPLSLCPSLPYVTAYVNPQDYTGLVPKEMALQRGSSFTNLYWPYNERQKC